MILMNSLLVNAMNICNSMYGLSKVAAYFKSIKPYYTAINYNRTKVAKRIYEMLSKRGYVDLRSIAKFKALP